MSLSDRCRCRTGVVLPFNHVRSDLKTVSLFATICLKYVPTNLKQHASKISAVKELSKDVETNKATRYLEYAIFRGKTHDMKDFWGRLENKISLQGFF